LVRFSLWIFWSTARQYSPTWNASRLNSSSAAALHSRRKQVVLVP